MVKKKKTPSLIEKYDTQNRKIARLAVQKQREYEERQRRIREDYF